MSKEHKTIEVKAEELKRGDTIYLSDDYYIVDSVADIGQSVKVYVHSLNKDSWVCLKNKTYQKVDPVAQAKKGVSIQPCVAQDRTPMLDVASMRMDWCRENLPKLYSNVTDDYAEKLMDSAWYNQCVLQGFKDGTPVYQKDFVIPTDGNVSKFVISSLAELLGNGAEFSFAGESGVSGLDTVKLYESDVYEKAVFRVRELLNAFEKLGLFSLDFTGEIRDGRFTPFDLFDESGSVLLNIVLGWTHDAFGRMYLYLDFEGAKNVVSDMAAEMVISILSDKRLARPDYLYSLYCLQLCTHVDVLEVAKCIEDHIGVLGMHWENYPVLPSDLLQYECSYENLIITDNNGNAVNKPKFTEVIAYFSDLCMDLQAALYCRARGEELTSTRGLGITQILQSASSYAFHIGSCGKHIMTGSSALSEYFSSVNSIGLHLLTLYPMLNDIQNLGIVYHFSPLADNISYCIPSELHPNILVPSVERSLIEHMLAIDNFNEDELVNLLIEYSKKNPGSESLHKVAEDLLGEVGVDMVNHWMDVVYSLYEEE